jgi:intein-like protein with splicing domain
MVSRFVPAAGLDATVAAKYARPFVDRLSEELLTVSRRYVPDAKVWLCLAPDTPVSVVGRATAVARRHYEGTLVRVSTASGRSFAITPEHRVLTSRGWVEAQFLNPCDDLFQVPVVEPAGAPDVQDRPPTIGEVVDALIDASPAAREVWSMRVGVDLDGHPIYSDVDVVHIDGSLAVDGQSGSAESVDHGQFVPADVLGVRAVLGLGHLGQDVMGLGAAGNGAHSAGARGQLIRGHSRGSQPSSLAVSSRGLFGVSKDPSDGRLRDAVLGGETALDHPRSVICDQSRAIDALSLSGVPSVAGLSRSLQLGLPGGGLAPSRSRLRPRTQGDSRRGQAALHGHPGAAEGRSDLCTGLPGGVAADRVVHVERYAFSGHVYDLSTETQWYLADGVIVHNSARDERVRHTHIETDGQTIPDNLRYKVPSTKGVGTDLARQPRDVALPLPNRINCRCASVPLPGLLAPTIHQMPTVLQGNKVTGGIESRFPRIAESHDGTSGDAAVPFMGRAIDEVAAAHRSARGHR